MAAKGTIEVEFELCKGCGICEINCPTGVIAMSGNVNGKGYRYAHPANGEKCTGCANCALVCPDAVITVYRNRNR